MSTVIVVATLRVREGAEEEGMAVLSELAERSQPEEGCLGYAVHRTADDRRTVVLVERWSSREALDAHFRQPHVAEAGARSAELLDGQPTILFLEPVPVGDPAKGVL
jgi:quinol monooxygenase YgiN